MFGEVFEQWLDILLSLGQAKSSLAPTVPRDPVEDLLLALLSETVELSHFPRPRDALEVVDRPDVERFPQPASLLRAAVRSAEAA